MNSRSIVWADTTVRWKRKQKSRKLRQNKMIVNFTSNQKEMKVELVYLSRIGSFCRPCRWFHRHQHFQLFEEDDFRASLAYSKFKFYLKWKERIWIRRTKKNFFCELNTETFLLALLKEKKRNRKTSRFACDRCLRSIKTNREKMKNEKQRRCVIA